MGVAKTDGTILLKPTYESISVYDQGTKRLPAWWRIYQSNKYGLMDRNFKETIPVKFDNVFACSGCDVSGNLVVVSLAKRQGLMTTTGKELLPPIYDQLRPVWVAKFPILIKQNNKVGLADSLGHILIPPTMDEIRYQQEDKTISLSAMNLYGVADASGKLIAEPVYGSIRPFSAGTATVEKDDKYGMINRLGKVIIPLQYGFLYRTGNYVIAEKDKLRGLLDLTGKVLLPFEYESLAGAGTNFFFKKQGTTGIISIASKVISKFNYEDVQFANGYFIVKKDGKYGVINTAGKVLIPIKYDSLRNNSYFLQDGTAAMVLDQRKGFVDLYGNEFFK